MKKYSITGWWSQPDFSALQIEKGRLCIATIKNNHAFSGIIVVREHGGIDDAHSVLLDKNGLAQIFRGHIDLKKGIVTFDKVCAHRTDIISYRATYHKEEGCWRGSFNGDAVGHGLTAFVIQELPEALFVEK